MCPYFKENNGNEQRLNLVIRSEKQQDLTFPRRTRRSTSKQELLLRLSRCIAMLNRAGEKVSTDSRAAEYECTCGG